MYCARGSTEMIWLYALEMTEAAAVNKENRDIRSPCVTIYYSFQEVISFYFRSDAHKNCVFSFLCAYKSTDQCTPPEPIRCQTISPVLLMGG